MIFTQETMPWKLTLIHLKTNKKYEFYKSITEYLDYDSAAFRTESTEKGTPSWKPSEVPTLSI